MKNTKIFAISILSVFAVVPSMAAPTHTSATFPQSGVMEEDYQYTGQANVTNLKVASGTANTLAGYTDCPSGYPNSDAGATSTDECYKACTVADLPANSHAATASGKNYSGANVTDTCAIATCETGYTFNPGNPDLMTLIGTSEAGTKAVYKPNADTNSVQPYFISSDADLNEYGVTQNGEFVVDYGTKGKIHGFARCSSQQGYKDTVNNDNDYNNPTTMSDISEAQAKYCWCKLDRYTSNENISQSISSVWVYSSDMGAWSGYGSCGGTCARDCAFNFKDINTSNPNNLAFRTTAFNAAAPSAPSCDANVITINWDHADSADITANDAGSVTYGGNINTPKKAQHINGKIFTGWTFVTPNQ